MITLLEIKNMVEVRTGKKDIADKSRKRGNIDAVKLYCFLSRKYTNETFTEIAILINRNHSTMVHHMKSISFIINSPFFTYVDARYFCENALFKIAELKKELEPEINDLVVDYEVVESEIIH